MYPSLSLSHISQIPTYPNHLFRGRLGVRKRFPCVLPFLLQILRRRVKNTLGVRERTAENENDRNFGCEGEITVEKESEGEIERERV